MAFKILVMFALFAPVLLIAAGIVMHGPQREPAQKHEVAAVVRSHHARSRVLATPVSSATCDIREACMRSFLRARHSMGLGNGSRHARGSVRTVSGRSSGDSTQSRPDDLRLGNQASRIVRRLAEESPVRSS